MRDFDEDLRKLLQQSLVAVRRARQETLGVGSVGSERMSADSLRVS